MRYSYLLLLLLLSISVFNIVSAIGPGINPADPDFISYFTDVGTAVVFNITGETIEYYNIYLYLGKYMDNPDVSAEKLYIELREGGLDGFTVADTWFNLSTPNVYTVFSNISLAPGTYAIVITPYSYTTSGTWYHVGAYIDPTRDPSIMYEYHGGWIEINKDMAFEVSLATPSQPGEPAPGTPRVIIVDRRIYTDHVEIDVILENWKPNSEVHLWLVYRYPDIDKALGPEVTVIVDENGYANATISVELSYADAVVKAMGYNADGELYIAYSYETVGIDFRPKGLLDIVMDWFNAILSYVSFVYAVVVSIIPYVGIFYFMALVGAFFNCIKEISIMPLYDFFYKQYVALMNIASLTIKVAEKLYQATKTLIEWLARIATIIVSLFTG